MNDQETIKASKNIPAAWHGKPKVMAIAPGADSYFDDLVKKISGSILCSL